MTNQQEKLYVNVWIGNLGKYNEGELVGEWFSLPCDMDEVSKTIGLNEQYEEYQINDFDTNIKGLEIHEYANIETLNEFAEQLDGLEEHEQLILQAYIEVNGSSNLLNDMDSISFDDARIYYDVNDMEDVAHEIVEESGMLNGVNETLARYFDYEAYGRDLDIEGTFVFLDGNICIELY